MMALHLIVTCKYDTSGAFFLFFKSFYILTRFSGDEKIDMEEFNASPLAGM